MFYAIEQTLQILVLIFVIGALLFVLYERL
jgi:hypothetical protein